MLNRSSNIQKYLWQAGGNSDNQFLSFIFRCQAREENHCMLRIYVSGMSSSARHDLGKISAIAEIEHYPARALRALGLLLADGAPTVGGGKTF